jgi:hypothetical protein
LAAPGAQSAAKDLAVMKQAAALQRQAALKAVAPAKSALVRQTGLAAQRLGASKSAFAQDLSQVKKSGQFSNAAKIARQAGTAGRQASRLTRVLQQF